ncbi:MAG TPA: type I-E CRISPR-associated protein Cse2/CasB [Gemmatimonadales bacterium]|nr:type I-E CRISPR-associated protein Cse2/CasB [Gemmatimonadales bacterium]
MRNRFSTFNSDQHYWVRQWHGALRRHEDKSASLAKELRRLDLGDRARLRRAGNGLDLVGEPAVHLLVSGLIERRQDRRSPRDSETDYYRLALVAGVIVEVNDDLHSPATLGRRLGTPEGGARVMSELRFRRLQATTEPEELLRLWRRAVALAGRKTDVATLADDLYTWLDEVDHPKPNPAGTVRFHWAYDYYQQPRDKASRGESTPEAEIVA